MTPQEIDHIADSVKKVSISCGQENDLISRQAAIDALDCINGAEEVLRALPTAQPEQQHGRIFQEIVVVKYLSCNPYPERKEKPYFLIKYTENGQEFIGYGTYKPEVLSEYLKEDFMPSAQPEPKWIPCSERLPERADNVIICYKAGDYTLVSTGRYLYKFKMWYVDVVGDLRDGVTAWMPFPEPYRGGEKDDR